MAAPHFLTFGPYALCDWGGSLEAKELKNFWARVDAAEGVKLSEAAGVYIIAINEGKSLSPIYVGRAEHGFRSRLKPAHDAFRKASREYQGKPAVMLFIARATESKGQLVRKRTTGETLKSIRDLEVMLIRDFIRVGSHLLNIEEKLFFERLMVPGYWNDVNAPKTTGSKALRKMLHSKKRS